MAAQLKAEIERKPANLCGVCYEDTRSVLSNAGDLRVQEDGHLELALGGTRGGGEGGGAYCNTLPWIVLCHL